MKATFPSPSLLLLPAMLLATVLFSPVVHAQEVSLEIPFIFEGTDPGMMMGEAVANAGDVNGDGLADMLIGMPNAPDGVFLTGKGKFRVYSGLDGSLIHEKVGDAAGDLLGFSVAGIGDIDKDGYADFAVGGISIDTPANPPAIPNIIPDTGGAIVYSGKDASVIYRLYGRDSGDEFGAAVSAVGNMDGDTYPDFAVGAPLSNGEIILIPPTPTPSLTGRVKVFSGQTGAVIHDFFGPQAAVFATFPPAFGTAIAGVGDLNKDGTDDIVIGSPVADGPLGPDGTAGTGDEATFAGVVYVYSGKDKSLLYLRDGEAGGDKYGASVSALGDILGGGLLGVDPDTTPDFVVGVPSRGKAQVYSGKDGNRQYELRGVGFFGFGTAVAGVGDVDGDGCPDLAVSTPRANRNSITGSGAVTIYSGKADPLNSNRLLQLFELAGEAAEERIGMSLAGISDLNGDSRAEVIIGAPLADPATLQDAGRVRVVSFTRVVSVESYIYSLRGVAVGDLYATSATSMGDADLDGIQDFAVGAPGINGGTGQVNLFSGATGTQRFILNGTAAGDYFGWSVGAAGDVNNDGRQDLIVGAPFSSLPFFVGGTATVHSGIDGAVLHTFSGAAADAQLGWAVDGAGDVNADGYEDVIVGAVGDQGSGAARIFSGKDGTELRLLVGEATDDMFGVAVAGVGDVNADGFSDVIVGANLNDFGGDEAGSAWVYSGKDGSVLHTFRGDAICDRFGSAVNAAGDVNLDGFDDVIVGAYLDDRGAVDTGSATVFSGKDGAVLHDLSGLDAGDQFGTAVAMAGDVNADGYMDVQVGAIMADRMDVGSNQGADVGTVTLFSGKDGSVLRVYAADRSNDQLGRVVDAMGDVNGDGALDLLASASKDQLLVSPSGALKIFSTVDLSLSTDTHFMSVLSVDPVTSEPNNRQQSFFVVAGAEHVGRNFWIFGSVSGIAPGVFVGGIKLPLNPDPYSQLTIDLANSQVLVNTRDKLFVGGKAQASIIAPPGDLPADLIGIQVHHAYLVFDDFGVIYKASNATSLTFTP